MNLLRFLRRRYRQKRRSAHAIHIACAQRSSREIRSELVQSDALRPGLMGSLPDEVWLNVVAIGGLQCVRVMSRVSRRFHEICCDETLWRKLLLDGEWLPVAARQQNALVGRSSVAQMARSFVDPPELLPVQRINSIASSNNCYGGSINILRHERPPSPPLGAVRRPQPAWDPLTVAYPPPTLADGNDVDKQNATFGSLETVFGLGDTGSFPLEHLVDACVIRPSCSCCGGGVNGTPNESIHWEEPIVIWRHDLVQDETLPAKGVVQQLDAEADFHREQGYRRSSLLLATKTWSLPSPENFLRYAEQDSDLCDRLRRALSLVVWGRCSRRDATEFTNARPLMPSVCLDATELSRQSIETPKMVAKPPALKVRVSPFHDRLPSAQFRALFEHPPPFAFEGLYIGNFESHGSELVEVEQRGYWLRARKLTGDPNVCAGVTTFFGAFSSTPQPTTGYFWGHGYIQLAGRGFRNPFWEQAVIVIRSHDEFTVSWILDNINYSAPLHLPVTYLRATATEAANLLEQAIERQAAPP